MAVSMMPARSKTIKVSDDEWRLIQRARQEIAKRGYEELPDDIEDEIEEEVDRDDLGKFLEGLALGAIAAVGAAAIISLLSGKRNP